MFLKFSATPSKAHDSAKAIKSAPSAVGDAASSRSHPANRVDPTTFRPAKRQKATRACDRCRLQRAKCDEQKPCTKCVENKTKCIVSYGPSGASPSDNVENDTTDTRRKLPTSAHHTEEQNAQDLINSGNDINISCSIAGFSPTTRPPLSSGDIRMDEISPWNISVPLGGAPMENTDASTPVQSMLTGEQQPLLDISALGESLFPQLLHPSVPSGEFSLSSRMLPKSQRSSYLRLYWDMCHPLAPVTSELDFSELEAMATPTSFDEYSARNALADCMIALGIQHSHITGLARRILGLQQHYQQTPPHVTVLPQLGWPGFEHFQCCRDSMRANKELTLDRLRCHILMILYFMRANAFTHAYNVLGITVRKAYVAKLHRIPPSHLSETQRTARMQLWSTLFSLDVQCSLQLDMPTAIQKSLVRCPFPTEVALARYIFYPRHYAEGIHPYSYSISAANLAVATAEASYCVSNVDLEDESDDSNHHVAALEQHARELSSALQKLKVWHHQLPAELLLTQSLNDSLNTEEFLSMHNVTQPDWQRRHALLIELQHHNAYTLIQRPFIRLRYANASGRVFYPNDQQPHIERHIASAFHHATRIIDMVFAVCSSSEILYGWPEILQPLWNATVTIVAYTYAHTNSDEASTPRVLKSLMHAQAVFESFSSTSPSAHSAKDTVQSLISTLQDTTARASSDSLTDDPMSWDLFASLLEESQMGTMGTELTPRSPDLTGGAFSPLTMSTLQVDTRNSSSAQIQ